jgi:hypothetical protein
MHLSPEEEEESDIQVPPLKNQPSISAGSFHPIPLGLGHSSSITNHFGKKK